MNSPSWVSLIPLPSVTTRFKPFSFSKFLIWTDTNGWLIERDSAALVTLFIEANLVKNTQGM